MQMDPICLAYVPESGGNCRQLYRALAAGLSPQQHAGMKPLLLFTPVLLGAMVPEPIQPGRWEVTSTIAELTAPGAPAFLVRMARGGSRTAGRCIAPAQAAGGIAAVLAPEAKARCTLERQVIADGRFTQTLACAQKEGAPLKIERVGSYDANGYRARATMMRETAKGAVRVVVNQAARRTRATC